MGKNSRDKAKAAQANKSEAEKTFNYKARWIRSTFPSLMGEWRNRAGKGTLMDENTFYAIGYQELRDHRPNELIRANTKDVWPTILKCLKDENINDLAKYLNDGDSDEAVPNDPQELKLAG